MVLINCDELYTFMRSLLTVTTTSSSRILVVLRVFYLTFGLVTSKLFTNTNSLNAP